MGRWAAASRGERLLGVAVQGDFRAKTGLTGVWVVRGEEGIGTSKIASMKELRTFKMEAVNSQEGGVGAGRGLGETS